MSGAERQRSVAYLAAKISAQLARETAGRYAWPHELADDAVALAAASYQYLEASLRGAVTAKHRKDVRKVVDKYGAQLIEQGDNQGMTLGVRWPSGTYHSGSSNVFFLV